MVKARGVLTSCPCPVALFYWLYVEGMIASEMLGSISGRVGSVFYSSASTIGLLTMIVSKRRLF